MHYGRIAYVDATGPDSYIRRPWDRRTFRYWGQYPEVVCRIRQPTRPVRRRSWREWRALATWPLYLLAGRPDSIA